MGRCPPRSSLCFIWPEGSPTDFVTKKTLCCLWSLENQFYCNRNNWLGHSSTSTITPRRFYLSRTRNKVSLTPLLPGFRHPCLPTSSSLSLFSSSVLQSSCPGALPSLLPWPVCPGQPRWSPRETLWLTPHPKRPSPARRVTTAPPGRSASEKSPFIWKSSFLAVR